MRFQSKWLEHGFPRLQHNSTQSAQMARTWLYKTTMQQHTVSTNGSNMALQVYNATVHSQHKLPRNSSPRLQHNNSQSAQMARTQLYKTTIQQFTISTKWLKHGSPRLQHNSTLSAQMALTQLSKTTTQKYRVSINRLKTALQDYNTTVHISINGFNTTLQDYNTTVYSQHKWLEHGSSGPQHNNTQSVQMA